jgi:hypothetical protein
MMDNEEYERELEERDFERRHEEDRQMEEQMHTAEACDQLAADLARVTRERDELLRDEAKRHLLAELKNERNKNEEWRLRYDRLKSERDELLKAWPGCAPGGGHDERHAVRAT